MTSKRFTWVTNNAQTLNSTTNILNMEQFITANIILIMSYATHKFSKILVYRDIQESYYNYVCSRLESSS